ncbi:MAG: hypothetical protein DCC73_14885 [Proteobacteria bacterium]|nr:MAG: hypothetical protein DCC73_14885 [Pseudomonadota bacterium]
MPIIPSAKAAPPFGYKAMVIFRPHGRGARTKADYTLILDRRLYATKDAAVAAAQGWIGPRRATTQQRLPLAEARS